MRTAAVEVGPLLERLDYLGTVAARREVQLVAEVGGTVVDLPLPEGSAVRAGSPLVHIAAPETSARLERVTAELTRARVEQEHACGRAATDEALGRSGDLPGAQVDLGRKACDAATAAVAGAEAALDEARIVSTRQVARAPFDGVVLQWLVDPGQPVLPGRPLLRLGASDREVRVRVSEVDRARIVPGGVAVVDLRAGPVRRPVASVAALALGPSRSFEVRIPLLPEDEADAWPGSSTRVGFVVAEEAEASTVPVHAVSDGRVFVVEGDRVAAHAVTLGPRGGGRVAIHPPLAAGTQVVTRGLEALDPTRSVWAVAEVAP